jgi:hypothetical protein
MTTYVLYNQEGKNPFLTMHPGHIGLPTGEVEITGPVMDNGFPVVDPKTGQVRSETRKVKARRAVAFGDVALQLHALFESGVNVVTATDIADRPNNFIGQRDGKSVKSTDLVVNGFELLASMTAKAKAEAKKVLKAAPKAPEVRDEDMPF